MSWTFPKLTHFVTLASWLPDKFWIFDGVPSTLDEAVYTLHYNMTIKSSHFYTTRITNSLSLHGCNESRHNHKFYRSNIVKIVIPGFQNMLNLMGMSIT